MVTPNDRCITYTMRFVFSMHHDAADNVLQYLRTVSSCLPLAPNDLHQLKPIVEAFCPFAPNWAK